MRDPTQCPACAGIEFWHIAEVLERDIGLTPMAVWIDNVGGRPAGTFELLVCCRCGLASWWVVDVESMSRHASMQNHARSVSQPCPECADVAVWHLRMFDQITGAYPMPMAATTTDAARPETQLWTWVCRGCGFTRWRVEQTPGGRPGDVIGESDCRSCRSPGAAMLVRAQDATALMPDEMVPESGKGQYNLRFVAAHTSLWGLHYLGWFALRICVQCRHVDWLGQALDQLRDRPEHGIRRVRGQ